MQLQTDTDLKQKLIITKQKVQKMDIIRYYLLLYIRTYTVIKNKICLIDIRSVHMT